MPRCLNLTWLYVVGMILHCPAISSCSEVDVKNRFPKRVSKSYVKLRFKLEEVRIHSEGLGARRAPIEQKCIHYKAGDRQHEHFCDYKSEKFYVDKRQQYFCKKDDVLLMQNDIGISGWMS